MRKPHKHAELIKAWADGADIEYKDPTGEWKQCRTSVGWLVDFEYRIKPEPKPDWRLFYLVTKEQGAQLSTAIYSHNLVLTFDGETGKLKSAEVI